jgi:predicted porin
MRRTIFLTAIFASIGVGSASAETVAINGFLTTSVARINEPDVLYLNSFSDQARFDNTDSRLGLQFSGDINDRISATAQLLARGRGGNDSIKTDWAFVAIDVADQAQIRTGKLKFPTFLVSDYIEVGYAYPWIRPPQEVYSLNPFSTLVGVDALYTPTFGSSGLLIQPYLGSNRGSAELSAEQAPIFNAAAPGAGFAAGDQVNFSAPVLAGLNAVANFPAGSVRMGYLQAEVDQADFGIEGQKAAFASVGLSLDWRNVVMYAEYADRNSEEGIMEQAFPDQRAGYVTLGYRFGRFLPNVTYASLDEGAEKSAAALKQTSGTVGLRYDFMDGAALKFEYQRIKPEEGNAGLMSRRLAADTDTVDLYGISLDVIF